MYRNLLTKALRSMTIEGGPGAVAIGVAIVIAQSALMMGAGGFGAAVYLGRKDQQVDTLAAKVKTLEQQNYSMARAMAGFERQLESNSRILENLDRALRTMDDLRPD